jgi:hypothetical protein
MKGEFPALHNEFLEAFFTMGIFPFFILLFGIVSLFRDYISFSSSRKILLGTRTSAFFGLLTIALSSFFDFPIHLPVILLLSAIFLGTFRAERIIVKKNFWKSGIFLTILLILSFPAFISAWMDYRRLNKSINEKMEIDMDLIYSRFLDSSSIERAGELYYRIYKETEDENFLYNSFILFERCVELNRMNYRCLYNLGVISIEMGDTESAKNYLKKSILINPLNPLARFLFGAILLKEGDEDGKKNILEAVRMAPELLKEAEKLLDR